MGFTLPQKMPVLKVHVCFLELFLTNGILGKKLSELTKGLSGLLGRQISGRSNRAATLPTIEFSKISEISAILSNFFDFFFKMTFWYKIAHR